MRGRRNPQPTMLASINPDMLTHHVHILEMNGESYRLKQGRQTSVMTISD